MYQPARDAAVGCDRKDAGGTQDSAPSATALAPTPGPPARATTGDRVAPAACSGSCLSADSFLSTESCLSIDSFLPRGGLGGAPPGSPGSMGGAAPGGDTPPGLSAARVEEGASPLPASVLSGDAGPDVGDAGPREDGPETGDTTLLFSRAFWTVSTREMAGVASVRRAMLAIGGGPAGAWPRSAMAAAAGSAFISKTCFETRFAQVNPPTNTSTSLYNEEK